MYCCSVIFRKVEFLDIYSVSSFGCQIFPTEYNIFFPGHIRARRGDAEGEFEGPGVDDFEGEGCFRPDGNRGFGRQREVWETPPHIWLSTNDVFGHMLPLLI